MKLVFNLEEVSEALGKTPEEFTALRPNLQSLGFPMPVPGLGEAWSIMHVIRWVNGEAAATMAAQLMADDDEDGLLAGCH